MTLPKNVKYKITHVQSDIYGTAPNGMYLDDMISNALSNGWKMEDIKIEVIPSA